MARITSLSMLLESSGRDYLAELYSKVIENIQKEAISARMKNMELSGDPNSGSVEAKRFANATSKDYGTARTAGRGDGIKVRPVTVALNVDKEIVEELAEKDIKLYGVDGVMDRRAANHALRMEAELDTAFFAAAGTAASAVTITDTDPLDIVEAMIQSVETTSNAFVDGVPRNMINVVMAPSVYGKLRNEIDHTQNATISGAVEEINLWHGAKVYSSTHLPEGVDIIAMADGSVAQPVLSTPYAAEKIPLSNNYGVELFYSYGTAAVTPDLIYKHTVA